VILHVRYTARQGGAQLRNEAVKHIQELIEAANTSGLVHLFSLKHDFPTEWHRFITGSEDFKAIVKKEYFPYFIQGKNITINKVELYAIQDNELLPATPNGVAPENLTTDLNDHEQFELSLPPDGTVLVRENSAKVFVLFRYSVS
jgi:hypothetical protein